MYNQDEFKINNFDLLRLIAATQVLVDHYFQHLNIQLSVFGVQLLYLFPGVGVFFIISGYLISASYERNNNLRIYFKNRALRIFPGLWGCLITTVIVISITGINFLSKEVLVWLPAQLIGLIYTPNFLNNYGFGSYNGSLWTIPLELQFYLLLPLLYVVIPPKKFNTWLFGFLVVFIILSLVCQIVQISPLVDKLITYSFVPHFYLFLIGVMLNKTRRYIKSYIYNKGLYWIIAYLALCFIPISFINPIAFLVIKNILLSVTILSLAYTSPRLSMRLLGTNDISYGVYIYHGLILTVIVQQNWAKYINIYYIIFFAYVLGLLSWKIIEKPFLKRKEKTIRFVK